MPNNEYVLTMARYNIWQNENLIAAANTLSDRERQMDRGAFFGSVQKTFSHVLWGDNIWLSRFTDTDAPSGGISQSVDLVKDWEQFKLKRFAFDANYSGMGKKCSC